MYEARFTRQFLRATRKEDVEAVREALYLGSNGGTQELGSWELCLTVTAVFALLSLVASAIVVARPSRS